MFSLFRILKSSLLRLALVGSLSGCYAHQGHVHPSKDHLAYARQACYRNDTSAARAFLNRIVADPEQFPIHQALAKSSLGASSLCVALESQLAAEKRNHTFREEKKYAPKS